MSKVALIAFTAFSNPPVIDNPSSFQQLDGVFYQKDLVVELVVNCAKSENFPKGSGIISYSRIEKLYCTPSADCFSSARKAISQVCK